MKTITRIIKDVGLELQKTRELEADLASKLQNFTDLNLLFSSMSAYFTKMFKVEPRTKNGDMDSYRIWGTSNGLEITLKLDYEHTKDDYIPTSCLLYVSDPNYDQIDHKYIDYCLTMEPSALNNFAACVGKCLEYINKYIYLSKEINKENILVLKKKSDDMQPYKFIQE